MTWIFRLQETGSPVKRHISELVKVQGFPSHGLKKIIFWRTEKKPWIVPLKYTLFVHCSGYTNSGSLYHAGKQLEQALFISKEENDLSQVDYIY